MRFHVAALTASCAVLALLQACAQTGAASPSLYEQRLAVEKGTTPGIVLIGARAPAAPASSASAASNAAPAEAGSSKTLMQRIGGALGVDQKPTGVSASQAKRLESPDQGIRLPSAATSPAPPASSAGKP